MENDPLDEILAEERRPANKRKIKKSAGKKKNGFIRFLVWLITLAMVAVGAVYLVQINLDIESEIQAAAIATANHKNSEKALPSALPTAIAATATPTPEPTPDPMAARTATISAQLTAVAEFQQTVTPNP